MKEKTAAERVRYAKRYIGVLVNGDASPLLGLSPDKRIHSMKGIASLSRFLGCYDKWMQIRQRYNLKWNTGTESLAAFERFFDGNKSLDSMIEWVRKAISVLPPHMGEIVKLNCLLGTRPNECIEAVRLIRNPDTFKILYNDKQQCLEYFRFPQTYLRKTKTAWISIIDKEYLSPIIQIVPKTSTPTYETLRFRLVRAGVACNLKWCRKIHASWLHQYYNVPEIIIDMVQGRCSRSVLRQHYLLPKPTFKDDILKAVKDLKERIEENYY